MANYLQRIGGLFKDFGEHVEAKTATLIEQSLQRRYRGIKLFESEEMKLLEAIGSGGFSISGFTNGDISERLYGVSSDRVERLRRSNRISYRFRLLRAHGLICKVAGCNRYRVSARGREVITAILQLQMTNLQTLNVMPA